MTTGFCLGILSERDHLEDPRLEEWLILKWSFRKWKGHKFWIEVVQGRNRKRKI